jgi:hypothetical protein
MTYEEGHLVTARILAMRDVIIRLLAYEARRHPDQRRLFDEFSSATADKLQEATGTEPIDETVILFQEMVQKEVDRIVGAARRIAAATPEEKSQ